MLQIKRRRSIEAQIEELKQVINLNNETTQFIVANLYSLMDGTKNLFKIQKDMLNRSQDDFVVLTNIILNLEKRISELEKIKGGKNGKRKQSVSRP